MQYQKSQQTIEENINYILLSVDREELSLNAALEALDYIGKKHSAAGFGNTINLAVLELLESERKVIKC